ncbi:MAG: hypothetical protein WC370_07270 [Dehalococcoidales bacterium]|jgi:hypothetical protein
MMKTVNTIETAGQTRKAAQRLSSRMEAIARGVQARYEESTGYTKTVTDETINIARLLGVPAAEIERWANNRQHHLAHDSDKLREIKSLLNKAARG